MPADEVWRRYFAQVRAAAASGLFDVLAHLDLAKVFGHAASQSVDRQRARADGRCDRRGRRRGRDLDRRPAQGGGRAVSGARTCCARCTAAACRSRSARTATCPEDLGRDYDRALARRARLRLPHRLGVPRRASGARCRLAELRVGTAFDAHRLVRGPAARARRRRDPALARARGPLRRRHRLPRAVRRAARRRLHGRHRDAVPVRATSAGAGARSLDLLAEAWRRVAGGGLEPRQRATPSSCCRRRRIAPYRAAMRARVAGALAVRGRPRLGARHGHRRPRLHGPRRGRGLPGRRAARARAHETSVADARSRRSPSASIVASAMTPSTWIDGPVVAAVARARVVAERDVRGAEHLLVGDHAAGDARAASFVPMPSSATTSAPAPASAIAARVGLGRAAALDGDDAARAGT